MRLSTEIKFEDKYDSPTVVVAPGGWCSCCCCWCWCHCHISNAMMSSHDDDEL